MMTESLYNYELEENGYLFLYNAASDQLLALLPEIAELYKAGRKRPGLIAEKHADLFNELCSKGLFYCYKGHHPGTV